MILFHQSYLLIIIILLQRILNYTLGKRAACDQMAICSCHILNLCHITAKTSQHKTAFDPPLRKRQFHMNSPLTSWHTLKFSTTLIHLQQLYIYFITSFLSFRALINTTSSLPSLLSQRGEDNDSILRYFRRYNFFFFPTSGK